MAKVGKDVTSKTTYSVRLTPELLTQLKHVAVDTRRTVSDLIEEGIRAMIKQYRKTKA
jgi:predicted DNA-binding protein